jgi:hypothetical protein
MLRRWLHPQVLARWRPFWHTCWTASRAGATLQRRSCSSIPPSSPQASFGRLWKLGTRLELLRLLTIHRLRASSDDAQVEAKTIAFVLQWLSLVEDDFESVVLKEVEQYVLHHRAQRPALAALMRPLTEACDIRLSFPVLCG